jgi:cytochrome c
MKARTLSLWCALGWAVAVPALAQTSASVASAERGKQLFDTRCFACHSVEMNRIGPNLGGVVGRPVGKAEGYFYSQALAAATHTWTVDRLKSWLKDPEKEIPGQEMNYRMDLEQDRADVVAYLASVSPKAKK